MAAGDLIEFVVLGKFEKRNEVNRVATPRDASRRSPIKAACAILHGHAMGMHGCMQTSLIVSKRIVTSHRGDVRAAD